MENSSLIDLNRESANLSSFLFMEIPLVPLVTIIFFCAVNSFIYPV